MHSWRVLLLPYLDASDVYQEYRFDEPWNGENNLKLARRIPQALRCPSFGHHTQVEHDDPDVLTNYTFISGARSAFPGVETTSFTGITDGLASTLLITEVNQRSVHWMQPEDLSEQQVSEFFGNREHTHIGGFHVLLANGHVVFINENADPVILDQLITIADGVPVGEF